MARIRGLARDDEYDQVFPEDHKIPFSLDTQTMEDRDSTGRDSAVRTFLDQVVLNAADQARRHKETEIFFCLRT